MDAGEEGSSRQRLLRTIDRQPSDHMPMLLRFWSLGGDVDNIPFNWRDEVERTEHTLALGLDDTLLLQPPLGYVEDYVVEQVPGVRSRTERVAAPGGEVLLKKIYETPDGPLQTVIRLTEDWPRGEDIRLFDDHNLSRLVEPLLKERADLRRLKHLLREPSAEQMTAFHLRAALLRREAQRLGVVLDGGWVALGDSAMWLCGLERILYGQMDEPAFIEEVLETILEWEMRRVDCLLDEGIDVLVQMAWYEGTDFWTPRNYRTMLKPRIMQLAQMAHSRAARFRYIITKGWKPYRQDLVEMGVDCISGVDPVQDRLDLAEVKKELGGRICLMGGLNSAVMLSQWDEQRIREAVRQAIEIGAAGGGFILYPVDAIFNTQDWDKVLGMIADWKELRGKG
jgi:hypothetical protein